ncbi:MAG: hypothetical protein VW475_14540 [Curvibacter sp.]
MTSCSKRTLVLALAGVSLGSLLGGCATTPPEAQNFVSVPYGTQLEYHRKSSGSYGNFDDRVTWDHKPGTWQGQPAMLAVSPQAGAQLYEGKTHGMVALLGRDGKPAVTYDPPLAYRWPMKVGDSYAREHKVTFHANGRTVSLTMNYRVEAYEKVTVPAGTFNAYRVVITDSNGEVQRVWVAPADSISVVKRSLHRPATHPQGEGHLEGQLLSRKLP